MTRINTNVSSLIAQKTLARSNTDLQTALTRLSTGLRINTGKDDPAGLIASENLRRDITSINKAITNSERANQLIATADSALGQVSQLLNDVRGLVTEAANTGALSDDQIAANQLQVDSSLEAIDRIAQVTTFQGRKILDGSLAFLTQAGTNFSTVKNLQIDQANLGTNTSLAIDVTVNSAATQAQITNTGGINYVAPVQATGAVTLTNGPFTLTATAGGQADGVVGNTTDVVIADGVTPGATYDSVNNVLTVTVDITGGATIQDIVDAVNNNVAADFTATTGSGGAAVVIGDATTYTDPLAGGADASGTGLGDDLVVEVSGASGSQVFNFQSGTTLTQVINAVNLVKDATGVEASNSGGNLQLQSTAYGSTAFVDVNVISEGASGTFATNLSATRATGTDINASVNGVQATGDGNTLSINTATLDLTATVADGSSTSFSFSITGGGARFQLGPQVLSNQQARLGIQSVNTARLGGVSGKLFELGSGGTAALNTDTAKAAKIVDETINQVTSLRGRLGAFQKTTLETNIYTLNDTLANLTDAQSSIRDADFAAESAKLTRAQILVQSGTSVLQIANSNPQNVLALLR